jgi:predicted metallo-beta-lactamase superfamily hydrolase
MLDKVKVTPLAGESFGVRSMCTFVETPDVKVLLDAGVSLAPFRFGLPPHPIEFQAILKAREKIARMADQADVVTISHYHFDHHTPSYEDFLVNWTELDETAQRIYQGKTVLAKNPNANINISQRRRAQVFLETGGKCAGKLEYADSNTFRFGKDTVLRFSEAVFHGSPNTPLGYVLMAIIECSSEKFLFAPDVQGPMSISSVNLIESEAPDVAMVGGPPFYLGGSRVDTGELRVGLNNMVKIARKVPVVVFEHHILRGADWRVRLGPVFEAADKVGHRVVTGAEYLGGQNVFLEFNRENLYANFPPSRDFESWMRLGGEMQSHNKPAFGVTL